MSTSISSLGTTVGGSTFGPDLQNAVNRAIAIASLPIQQMTAEQQLIQAQSSELNTISGLFTTLQSSLQSFPSGSGSSGLAAAVSDQTVLQANLTGSSLQGSYTIQVLNPGSSSTAVSSAGSTPVTDPTSQNISSSTSFTLTVGTTGIGTPAGLYNSVLDKKLPSLSPPATNTWPSPSKVAVWIARAVFKDTPEDQLLAAGS